MAVCSEQITSQLSALSFDKVSLVPLGSSQKDNPNVCNGAIAAPRSNSLAEYFREKIRNAMLEESRQHVPGPSSVAIHFDPREPLEQLYELARTVHGYFRGEKSGLEVSCATVPHLVLMSLAAMLRIQAPSGSVKGFKKAARELLALGDKSVIAGQMKSIAPTVEALLEHLRQFPDSRVPISRFLESSSDRKLLLDALRPRILPARGEQRSTQTLQEILERLRDSIVSGKLPTVKAGPTRTTSSPRRPFEAKPRRLSRRDLESIQQGTRISKLEVKDATRALMRCARDYRANGISTLMSESTARRLVSLSEFQSSSPDSVVQEIGGIARLIRNHTQSTTIDFESIATRLFLGSDRFRAFDAGQKVEILARGLKNGSTHASSNPLEAIEELLASR